MWSFPARFLAEFFDNHGMLGVPRPPALAHGPRRLGSLRRGSDRARSRERLRLMTPVQPIARDADHVLVKPRGAEPSALTRWCSPRTPTRRCTMLADATDREREILGSIPYQANEAVLHTDVSAAAAPAPRLGELELPPAPSPGERPPSPIT